MATYGRSSGTRNELVGAHDLEVLVDEDVVRPVDADVVDLVFSVAQLHNTVDDAARVRRRPARSARVARSVPRARETP